MGARARRRHNRAHPLPRTDYPLHSAQEALGESPVTDFCLTLPLPTFSGKLPFREIPEGKVPVIIVSQERWYVSSEYQNKQDHKRFIRLLSVLMGILEKSNACGVCNTLECQKMPGLTAWYASPRAV